MISFLSVFPPYRGGISTFSDHLYRHLVKREKVNAYNFKKLYPSLLFPGKSQKREKTGQVYAAPLLHSFNPLNWGKSGDYISGKKPDYFIYSYWNPFFAPAYSRILSRLKRRSPSTETLCIAHNILPHEWFPLDRFLMKRMLVRTGKVVLLSEQTNRELGQLGIDIEHLKLFHPVYPVDPPEISRSELRRKYGFRAGDRIILFFGLVRPYKGLDLLIRALNSLDLADLQVKPLIAGEFYDDKSRYTDLIKENHKSSYTIIDQFVTDKELAEIFTISDLLVLPYRTASQSGILANAIQFQLPSIVSNQPGLTEHIEDGITGYIFESGNIEALKEAIQAFIRSGNSETIRENLLYLKGELSWEHFTEELLDFLK